MDELAVNNFREYLRIPSVHPNVNYDGCLEFLEKQAQSLDLPFRVFYCFPKKPIVVMTWIGEEPDLPSIMLNSHMDVVPVFEDQWSYTPFGAEMDKEGNIYARGAQDTKCIGIQYLEAIRRMKKENTTLKRTLHVSFVPDEEIGGVEGMKAFVNTKDFKDLNIGFAIDEGATSDNDDCIVYYGEKSLWHINIHCPGQPGHASLLFDNTAGEKVRYILDRVYEFRDQEKQKLKNDPPASYSDITSINVTKLQGGVQTNVLPVKLVITIDSRISFATDIKKFEETLNKWCKDAGDDIWIEYEHKDTQVIPTKLDESNLYWMAFKKAAEAMNLTLGTAISFGTSDMRFLRELGVPAINFAPMNNTVGTFHANDEFLNKDIFLRGIEIYRKLIIGVANLGNTEGGSNDD